MEGSRNASWRHGAMADGLRRCSCGLLQPESSLSGKLKVSREEIVFYLFVLAIVKNARIILNKRQT